MFPFKKHDPLKSEEMEIILKKINTLHLEFGELQGKFKALETSYDDLRGKFNRKLSMMQKQEATETTAPAAEDLNRPFSVIAGYGKPL
jgi:ABC-type phosphate transport system auxiliary subunit